MLGALPAAVVSDRYGRRVAMFVGAWCIIVGTVISATANVIAQFTVGRFVLGIGITVMFVAAPAYSMEIAPPQWRGRCTGRFVHLSITDLRFVELRMVWRIYPRRCGHFCDKLYPE